jgi:predicted component of type VI protein secretion system
VARLLLESGGERREIKVAGPVTVGRSPSAGVYLDDKTLSREHTQFYLLNGRLHVRDLQSKNGTYLNGALLQRAEPLKHGDRVKVSTAVFTVALEAGDAMPAVTAPLAVPPPRPAAPPAPVRTTVTAPAASAPRRVLLGGPHPFAVFLYRIILIVVIIIVAYVSKGFYRSLLSGIAP